MKIPALVLALMLPASAMAGDFRFDYSPEYLATPEGVQTLHGKLEIAAKAYCRDQFITLNVRGVSECSKALIEQTVQQIGNARLADYQAVRTQRSS
jgi:UrcA family protein